jgi:uncharacterized protein (DUF1800 family)
MVRNRTKTRWGLLSLIAVILTAFPVLGQADPDPNSPEPVLLRQENSKRILSVTATRSIGRVDPRKAQADAFAPGSDVVIFATNLDLMKGEGANAFRVNVTDAAGRNYRFPVIDLTPLEMKGYDGVYAVTIWLTDELGLWREPITQGDVHVRLTWRGMASETGRLGYGFAGGSLKDVEPQTGTIATKEQPSPEYVSYRWSGDRMRFLEQAGFGPNQALDQRIRRIGVRTYLAEQFEIPYPSAAFPYPDIPLRSTNTEDPVLGCGIFASGTAERRLCFRDYYSMYPVQTWFFKEALYGDAQLRHKIAWGLSQIWVISGVDTQQSSWMLAYHKDLSKNAFGNYRDLMKDMTLNPGMGNYLDMARSTRNNPNENFPREILQLFTIGLFMLNQDGTLMLDGQGNPIPTYDQETVDNFTKVLTGWTFCNVGCPNSLPSIVNYKDPMVITNANNHNITAKTLLNYPNAPNPTIPACTGCTGTATINYANASLDQTLDNIFHHPNVAPFVSKLLIQHLVTSDPSPAYVGRVAATFNNNGMGVRGDMKSVIRAILLDPEARGDVKTDPNFGKLREPVQFVTNILRALDVKSSNLAGLSDGFITNYTTPLAQNPFNSPTVFNYYPPDYVIPGTSLLGPEFGIMTTGTAIARANVVNTITFGQIGVSENSPSGTRVDLAEMQALATADPTGNQLLDVLNHRMLHNTMSPQMRSAILPAFAAVASTNPLARAQAAIYLVATSSQFQVQR